MEMLILARLFTCSRIGLMLTVHCHSVVGDGHCGSYFIQGWHFFYNLLFHAWENRLFRPCQRAHKPWKAFGEFKGLLVEWSLIQYWRCISVLKNSVFFILKVQSVKLIFVLLVLQWCWRGVRPHLGELGQFLKLKSFTKVSWRKSFCGAARRCLRAVRGHLYGERLCVTFKERDAISRTLCFCL